MNKKYVITAFIAGILLTVFTYHAYVIYSVRNVTIQNIQAITEIVQFINNSIQPQQGTPNK